MKTTIVFLAVLLLSFELCMAFNNQNKQIQNFDVVIVGGGFSGLTAAHYLKNKKILVLEKEKVAGGRCISGKWNGFHYPKGTEYIGAPEQPLKGLLKKLKIKAKQIPAPTDGIAYNGKFYLGNELLNFLDYNEKAQYYKLEKTLKELADDDIEDVVFEDQEELNEYTKLDKISVKDWLNQQNYSPLIQKFVDVENRGLFGTNNANYSMLFNIPEMAFDLPLPSSIFKSEVYSFDQGMYSIINAMTTELKDKLISEATVTNVTVNNDKSVEVSYLKHGQTHKVRTKTVIMATPAPISAAILKNEISTKVSETLIGLKYSKYATINFFTKKRLLHETWSVSCIDEGSVVTLYDAIRPQVNANYNGKSILSVYMAPKDAYDQTFTKQSDEELLKEAYHTLNKYYPEFENEILGYDINRFEYAFPIFAPAYAKKLEVLLNDESVNGPIYLAGDYMVYATVDGAIISAKNAAKQVQKYLRKVK